MPNNSIPTMTTFLEHPGLASSGAESIAGHEHLLIEILIRLPAKSLVKFKSVSKPWNFLICSPNFSLLHSLHNPSDSIPISGIFLRKRCVPSPMAYQFLSISLPTMSSSISTFRLPGSVVSILQSSNGLLLYYSVNSSDLKVLNLHVYNPTTGHLRTIPSIQSSFISAALAFDPHSSSKGYKVISVHTTVSADHYTLKIYSSETQCWKDLDGNNMRVPLDMELRNSVFWRGAIHWVCENEHSFYLEVDKESVMKMPSPPISGSERGYMKCLECKGKLWCLWRGYSDMILKVYMMESYEEGWFLKFTLNLGVITSELTILSLINSRRCNGGEGYMMVIHVPGKILGYEFEDGKSKEICKVPLIEGEAFGKRQSYWFDAHPYSYSLACV